jgi:hypothetical protein
MPPGRSPHQTHGAGRAQQLLLPGLPALTLNTRGWQGWWQHGISHTVAKSFREDVLMCSLNGLMRREAL